MLLSAVLTGLAILFKGVSEALIRLFNRNEDKSAINNIDVLNMQDFEIKSKENNDSTVSLSKNEIISYFCENCSRPNGTVFTVKAKEHGTPTGSGISFGKEAQNRVREGSFLASSDKIFAIVQLIQSGIEKAIRKHIYIDAICLECKTTQSWSKDISTIITTKSMVFLSGFLLFITILFLGFSGLGRGDITYIILISLIVILVFVYIILTVIGQAKVRKKIQKLENSKRPQVVSNINKFLESFQSSDVSEV